MIRLHTDRHTFLAPYEGYYFSYRHCSITVEMILRFETIRGIVHNKWMIIVEIISAQKKGHHGH